nr:MAG TPA: hypothetical protein [Caudoviricetes sp.]
MDGGANSCQGSTCKASAIRSNVGKEGLEIVAETLDCVTPILSAISFCVSPLRANISLIYTFMLLYVFNAAKIRVKTKYEDMFILIGVKLKYFFVFYLEV